MRTTVRLSDDLLREARKRAAAEGRTLTSLLEEGLRIALAESRPARRKLIRLPVSRKKGGTLPGIDLNRSSDLEDQMESA